MCCFFFSSRRRHTRCALVTGVQTCALPILENFRPGVARRIGLDIEKITASRPQLIWASISGFGQTGPDSTKPAYDMIVQALSGVMSKIGRESCRERVCQNV